MLATAKARSPSAVPTPSPGGLRQALYTDLATFECRAHDLELIDAVEGLRQLELERLLGLPFKLARRLVT